MRNYLTYFTSRTKEELDSIIEDLCSILGETYEDIDSLANDIIDIFLNDFDVDSFYSMYGIDVSKSFTTALYKTLRYDDDTNVFIDYIYNLVNRLV